jgi:hypothetical protein
MSLEMAHKVILPPKKNYIPQFLKQRDINSYYGFGISMQIQEVFFWELKLYEQLVKVAENRFLVDGTEMLTRQILIVNYGLHELRTTYK